MVPGYIALWGVGFLVPGIEPWLIGADDVGPTIGGFLYLTVGCVSAGMFASAVRWAILDTVHHRTGIVPTRWSDRWLHERVHAYEWIVENHYRYYQFYANSLVAIVFTYLCWRFSTPGVSLDSGWVDVAVFVHAAVCFAGSRDALRKYYRRASSLLDSDKEIPMTNGGHPKPPTKPKAGSKPGPSKPKGK
ncbi:MAG: hypothetical protein KF705_02485 [Phycisphaeraceae bacterium]|nr:hypothetical protein [Phycisphaeraceae bacterium]